MNVDQAANLATSFGSAAERCLEQRPLPGGRFQMLAVPAITCAAFSIELGLKTLIMLRGREKWGHELNQLFLALDDQDQVAVLEAMGADRGAVMGSLSKAAKVFEEWRYIFEIDSAMADIAFLQAFARAVGAVVAARRE